MPRGTLLSLEERAKIDALSEEELTPANIAKRIKRTMIVAKKYLSSPGEYGKRLFTQGNKKPSDRDRRVLVRNASKQGSSAAQLRSKLHLPISKRRVQQILSAQEHLSYRSFKKAPPLTARHKTHRLNWAHLRHSWTPQQWGLVIFSDEKKFHLDDLDGSKYYWHDLRKEERVLSRRQKNGGGVMIWGAFCENGVSSLAFLSGNQFASMYTRTPERYLLPFAREKYRVVWIFQQDNASIHSANVTKQWIRDKNIDLMDWPAKSPDLNPIDNLCGVLARRVYASGGQFDTVPALKTCILEEWDKIDRSLCYRLIRSMTDRCAAVLERQGLKMDY